MFTKQKLFSSSMASTEDQANTNANANDMALPGTLPVLNPQCLNKAILASLALKGTLNNRV